MSSTDSKMSETKKKKKSKRPKNDERFSEIGWDPKFRRLPRQERKVTVDKRFEGMFKDDKFKLEYSVDKRGRPLKQTSTDHLKKFYDLPSEGEEESSDEDEAKIRIDLARGDGNLSSSDDSGSEWEVEEEEIDKFDHEWGELDKNAKRVDEATKRFAVCNMDWDRMRAVDLLMLFNSFKPTQGMVESVKIYKSEFGKERIEQEEISGPTIAFDPTDEQNVEEEEKEEGEEEEIKDGKLSKVQMEKLRQYQLERLRYFYAIVECDNVETANSIYEQCDGIEYETSSAKLDLRFVPNDMSFDDEPKEEANSVSVEDYKPRLFQSSALQMSNVQLTWDETDPERHKALTDAFENENEEEIGLNDYLAPGSSDDDEDDEEKFGELVKGLIDQPLTRKSTVDNDVEMEISWEPGFGKEESDSDEEKEKNSSSLTPWQEYLERRKEKRRNRKADIRQKKEHQKVAQFDTEYNEEPKEAPSADLELLFSEEKDLETSHKHFKLKDLMKEQKDAEKVERKLKRKKVKVDSTPEEGPFQIDVKDSRFNSLYSNHLFNIDPSDPSYKKTQAMELLVKEKVKRSATQKPQYQKKSETVPIDNDVSNLLKSVKSKAEKLKKKRKRVEN